MHASLRSIRFILSVYLAISLTCMGLVLWGIAGWQDRLQAEQHLAKQGHVALNAYAARFVSAQAFQNKLPDSLETRQMLPGYLFDNVALWDNDRPSPRMVLHHAEAYTFNHDALKQASQNAEGYFEKDGYLYLYHPIQVRGIELGALGARVSVQHLVGGWQRMWWLLAGVLVFGVGILLIFQRQIKRVLEPPMEQLTMLSARIGAEQNYSLRASRDEPQEFSELYDSYNGMLDEIAQKHGALQELQQSLEARIADRVKDLSLAKEQSEGMLQEVTEARVQAETLATALASKQEYDLRVSNFYEAMQRQSSDNIEKWGEHILEQLVQAMGAVQATLYTAQVLEDDIRLRLISTYGIDVKAILKRTVKAGDGVAGQVVKTRQMVLLEPLPADFLKIASTLGETSANAALIVPLIAEDQVQGLIEIGSLGSITEDLRLFVQEVSKTIAYTLLVIKNKDNIEALLRETRQKNTLLETSEEALRKREEELKHMNENLEQLVQRRTADLARTLENLQQTQAQLVQNEKMASLGQLIAGIAHEINTPIGAVKASAGNLQDSIPRLLSALPKIARELDTPQYHQLILLVEEVMSRQEMPSSREQRKHRKELTEYLRQKQVPHAEEMARTLVEVGVWEQSPRYDQLLRSPYALDVLDAIYQIGQMKMNAQNIELAAERTKKITFALKNYAYRQKEEEMVRMNVVESLDVILTLYHGQLRQGVELVTEYPDAPAYVMAFPDEIGQVWTNLITNAIHAMEYNGKLSIKVQPQDERVLIEVADTGPGIPLDIQQRIFEPFFTTKRQGEGTGLGLDICRRIIDKHNGAMTLKSQPGHTVFEVLLPLAPEEA
jgi:C4-dicarboxylate-specific signal transduction histidine kinase